MKKNIVIINSNRCKSCLLCIESCKSNIISVSEDINSMGYHPVFITDMSKCTGCTLCARVCPDAAIEVYMEEEEG
ncbi:MAG TPA: 4Fe-4S binding protein [Spirochaetota bacterium]|nr:4Fe-4S binding protein [Spirochaetota bacterium]HOL56471.1 4Fe-4S binding protein [Spirochaetota bacterium]HPP03394.1 4Fe-4S binding protein [Spirochaetota bacterium]